MLIEFYLEGMIYVNSPLTSLNLIKMVVTDSLQISYDYKLVMTMPCLTRWKIHPSKHTTVWQRCGKVATLHTQYTTL